MTINQALKIGTNKLIIKKIGSAGLDAEILLSHTLKVSKEFIFAHPELKLSRNQIVRYQKSVSKRCTHYPIAYLTGEKEFYGYKFLVNEAILIPRPQTEELVEKALKMINDLGLKNIADIGTGSGNIIISLVNELKKKYGSLKGFKFYATDISQTALVMAKKNARFHQATKFISFYPGDLLTPLKNKKINLIIANLPYLGQKDIRKEKSIQFEPKKALVGNYYKKLFSQAKKYFKPQPIIIYEDKKGIHTLIRHG